MILIWFIRESRRHVLMAKSGCVTIWGTNYSLQGDGVTPVVNPDAPQKALYGNMYQWGRFAVVANADTPVGAISGWDATYAPDDAWNTGTAANPVKTAQDPCLLQVIEFLLMQNGVQYWPILHRSLLGPGMETPNPNDYSAAAVLKAHEIRPFS